MIPPEGLTVPALLSAAATQDREAVVFPDGRCSVSDLVELSNAYAAGFLELGVGPGDHVGAVLPAGLPVVAMILGAGAIGAVAVPINNRLRPKEMAYIVDNADMRTVLISAEHVESLSLALPSLAGQRSHRLAVPEAACLRSIVVIGCREHGAMAGTAYQDWDAVLAAADTPARRAQVAEITAALNPDDEFMMVYTSGTTSNPRGCLHTHASVVRQGASLSSRIGLRENDRFWTPLPFFHVGGFDVLFATLTTQSTMLHMGRFEPGAALAMLENEKATAAFPAFETIWLPILNHPDFGTTDLSAVRTVINVATPERMRMMQEMIPHAVQISCTGSTEAAGFVCVGDRLDSAELRSIYAGRPVSGMEAKIIHPETGADLPDGTPGEFIFRGVSRFLRYYRDPGTTNARIDADGWYHSGDLLERDAAGRFRFYSRLGDVLKVGGENVAAADIEDQITTHPAVALVQVVAAPDDHYREVAAAFVELLKGKTIKEQELIEFCMDRMASYKVPRYVRVVTEWPMSGTKIQKTKLRECIAAELAAASITVAPRLPRRQSPMAGAAPASG